MKYDINNVPPSASQIEIEQRKAKENVDQLAIVRIIVWAILLTTFLLSVVLELLLFNSLPQILRVGFPFLSLTLWFFGYIVISSHFQEQLYKANDAILKNDYLDDFATKRAVFERMYEQNSKITRYVNVVHNQNRSLTYGEYVEIQSWIIKNQKPSNTKLKRSIEPHKGSISNPITEPDSMTIEDDAIFQF